MKYLALYLRLSLEDKRDIENGKIQEESNSITNQRKQIYEYIHCDSELNQYEVMEFCDDGYSGTNMERPGMQKMLEEIKADNIQCIIVKDMSRFSRDYIEMGIYLNQIFPFMGIRFIAINDHYDNREHQGSTPEIDTVFQTLLYDLYSKDISLKVKASFENKCANGEYVFGQVPFGYEKSREVKNDVVVNQKEAEIVRYVFFLAIQGKSSRQIARQLCKEKVPTILQMRKPDREENKARIWSENAVRRILNNRFYLGEMAYGKSVRKSVGSKSGISVPREEWKVIEDHHEALISKEIFEQVSSFREGRLPKRKKAQKHPLTGKLYCGGCGYSLDYKPLRGKNRYRRFECRKHAFLKIPECCTYMRADRLEETVLFLLQMELGIHGDALKLMENLALLQKTEMESLKRKQQEYRAKKRQTEVKKILLYENYALHRSPASGETEAEEYRKRAGELTQQISLLSKKNDEIAVRLTALEKENLLQQFLYNQKLTKDLVDIFIRSVYAYKDKRIEIEWNFRVDYTGATKKS